MIVRATLYALILCATAAVAFFAGSVTGSRGATPDSAFASAPLEGEVVRAPAGMRVPAAPSRDVISEAAQRDSLSEQLALLMRENDRLRSDLHNALKERDLLQMQCQDQLAIQFIAEYSSKLEKEDISLVLGQVVDALQAIPSDHQITQFLAGHRAYMQRRSEVDQSWFAIKGDMNHPDAHALQARRAEIGEAWRFELERIFGVDGARLIVERP